MKRPTHIRTLLRRVFPGICVAAILGVLALAWVSADRSRARWTRQGGLNQPGYRPWEMEFALPEPRKKAAPMSSPESAVVAFGDEVPVLRQGGVSSPRSVVSRAALEDGLSSKQAPFSPKSGALAPVPPRNPVPQSRPAVSVGQNSKVAQAAPVTQAPDKAPRRPAKRKAVKRPAAVAAKPTAGSENPPGKTKPAADLSPELERKLEVLLEEEAVPPHRTVNVADPLGRLAEELLTQDAGDVRFAVNTAFHSEPSPEEVVPYREVVGRFSRTSFEEIRERLEGMRQTFAELTPVEDPRPLRENRPWREPELVRPEAPVKVAEGQSPAAPAGEAPGEDGPVENLAKAEAAPSAAAFEAEPVEVAAVEGAAGAMPESADVPSDPSTEPQLVVPTAAAPSGGEWARGESATESGPTLVVPGVSTASPAPTAAAPRKTEPEPSRIHVSLRRESPRKTAAAEAPVRTPASRRAATSGLQETPAVATASLSPAAGGQRGGIVFGDLSWDGPMQAWLDEHRGHIELYLHPVGSRNSQDTIFVDYRFPEDRFRFDLRDKKGSYRLYAGVFVPEATIPIAQVPFATALSAENYRKKVEFRITKAAFEQVRHKLRTQVGGIKLTATIFQGAAGNPRKTPVIPGATVQVVGFPEFGVRLSDAEGNVTFDKVPNQSEYLIRVSAPGHFPSYHVVPVYRSDAYVPLYLVSEETVRTINEVRFLRSQEVQSRLEAEKDPERRQQLQEHLRARFHQDRGKGLLIGRLFDPVRRTPLAGEKVRLTFRKDEALYFGALPDENLRATTEVGMFAFFNILPSFRAVRRETEGGLARRAALIDIRPGTAQYVEYGRGGYRGLIGRLIDPFNGRVPEASIRIVGDRSFQTAPDATGRFEIPRVDFGPGVVTVEVEARGYPITWYTSPWSPLHPSRSRDFFMMESEALDQSAKLFAGLTPRSDGGTVVGGAEPGFFSASDTCVRVHLLDSEGKPVPDANGPFPLVGKGTNGPLCLSREKPGFAYYNLSSGRYLLRWETPQRKVLRAHVLHVGNGRATVVVN